MLKTWMVTKRESAREKEADPGKDSTEKS